jgi:hypothetical protein|uniref:hypothetical protein n=1 Tax=Prosthecobacter sp. TaxID=1965333 RepID=UPI003784BFD6
MFRRITSKRATRTLLWIVITIVTLTVLLFVWTNWSGKRRWAATKALIEREGETRDFHKLLPITPPEASNLLAIEPLDGIAADIESDNNKGGPGAKRKALVAMKWNGAMPPAEGVTQGKTTDFQEWVKILRETNFIDLSANSQASGNDVLTALDAKLPVLKQLADEVVTRPQAMFTPGLREREMPDLLFALRLPHYNAGQNLAKALSLRARAAVASKDSVEATRSLLVITRLAQACKQEPLMIGFLVGNTLEMMALEPLWLGLREHVFSEGDLMRLQDAFATDETTPALLLAMRGELAAGLNAVEHLQTAAEGQTKDGKNVAATLFASGNSLGMNVWRMLPNGLFDHWKSVIANMELHHLIQPLKNGGLPQSVRAGDAVASEIKSRANMILHPDHIMVNLMLPAVTQISVNALLTETRRRQALAAVALERFHLRQAKYPRRLEELVPSLLPAAPLDPCDGKPLRYRLTESGRFILWSVGFDGRDDAGKVTAGTKLNKREYVGDWAWQYEPAK